MGSGIKTTLGGTAIKRTKSGVVAMTPANISDGELYIFWLLTSPP